MNLSYEEATELSVIVPVLNEEENLQALFQCLSAQRSVRLELVLSDGGSSDGTVARGRELERRAPFPCRIITGTRGRAAQQNRGVAHACATLLLFLHVDSSFDDPLAFRKALDSIAAAAAARGDDRVAGHFPLRFDFSGDPPLPYRYYQRKARLHRPGCTHGDQGFLMSRRFFQEIGPFDESLPLMEDTFLAEKIRQRGAWLLFPSPITTSPRRFQREGLLPRQTLNAVLMNLAALQRLGLLTDVRSTYKSHDSAGRLALEGFLIPLRRTIARLPLRERMTFWYESGSYVRRNAWQVPFFMDVMVGGKEKEGATEGKFLQRYDRYLERLTDNVAGRVAATVLVWGWFRMVTLRLRLKSTPCSPERSA
ncbi:TIGR04283 family arsenosugar biosynthesis glycosyltransferase [Geomonas sp. RF6]|uniref:TIGR04283 family arsenosugar biosynthesis glycosyltransferase n=1 Tax=Geomonas sp. RF6 TaxID=2897342 RepID=UPI001E5DEF5F|nr:TIGR04283 family arsenosugar biosynthesis glycosyltransferase [Geomonas sp. RF6]UFS71498.1 TIGR04283 family arsenosugar biosynthesis glycosyltransferase [Geomonas sp. RF6]